MSYLVRNGALNRVLAQSTLVRKDDRPHRAMTADEVAESHDALLSSLGGSRFFVDARAQDIAKHEGIERHRRQVAKADADRDAAFGKAPLVLLTEERRRNEAAAPTPAVPATVPKPKDAALQAFTKGLEDARAEFEAAMKRSKAKMPPDDDGDYDDDGNDGDGAGGAPATAVREPPPKAKPGTSNLIHEPSKDGVHAKRDGRTITSTHAINRKINLAKVSKGATPDSGPFIDLSTWFGHRPA